MDTGTEPRQGPFTAVERARRLREAHRLMVDLGLDCLVTAPGFGGLQPDSTYLRGSDGRSLPFAYLLPAGEAPPDSLEREDGWPGVVVPFRSGTLEAAERIAGLLRQVPLSHKRVGITGIGRTPASPDGTMPAGIMALLERAFEGVAWVDVTEELRIARMVKSPEEIAVLVEAVGAIEAAVDRVAEVARPGVTDLDLWATLVSSLVRQGSDPPTTSPWASGLRPVALHRPPHGELQRGSIVVLEPEAAVAGYRARCIRPLAIEACDAVFRDLCTAQAEYWQRCFELIVPGRPLGDVFAEAAAAARQLAARPGRYEKLQGSLTFEGCGLGFDGPTFAAPPLDAARAHEAIRAGWAFQLVAPLSLDIGPRLLTASWSDVVVVDEAGPRRLGRRPPGLLVAGEKSPARPS